MDRLSPGEVSFVFVSSDHSEVGMEAFLSGKDYLLSVPWDRERLRMGLYKCGQVLMIPSLYIVDVEARQIVTRFGALAVEHYPASALAAWKRGASGYFPDWFERRRVLSFNFGGFLVWFLTTLAVLHYGFGLTFSNSIGYYYHRMFSSRSDSA